MPARGDCDPVGGQRRPFPGRREEVRCAEARRSFIAAAQGVAFAKGAHLVAMLNAFEANGTAYAVMEREEGTDLAQTGALGPAFRATAARDRGVRPGALERLSVVTGRTPPRALDRSTRSSKEPPIRWNPRSRWLPVPVPRSSCRPLTMGSDLRRLSGPCRSRHWEEAETYLDVSRSGGPGSGRLGSRGARARNATRSPAGGGARADRYGGTTRRRAPPVREVRRALLGGDRWRGLVQGGGLSHAGRLDAGGFGGRAGPLAGCACDTQGRGGAARTGGATRAGGAPARPRAGDGRSLGQPGATSAFAKAGIGLLSTALTLPVGPLRGAIRSSIASRPRTVGTAPARSSR